MSFGVKVRNFHIVVTEHGGGGDDLKEESIRDTVNTFQHGKEYMRVGEVCQGSDKFV